MDVNYWTEFYKNNNHLKEKSQFAFFVKTYIDDNMLNKNLNILDLGCGNGRDTYYLSQFYKITGCDLSIELDNNDNYKFIKDNMVTMNKENYNFIYMRFSFHSITNNDHDQLLEGIKSNTYLAIETRSNKSSDINKVFGDNHYRNYTDYNYIIKLLNQHNFEILYKIESNDLAIYKDENPICIRIIAKKKI